MSRGSRLLGFLAESLIILLSFAAAVFARFGTLQDFLSYSLLVPKAPEPRPVDGLRFEVPADGRVPAAAPPPARLPALGCVPARLPLPAWPPPRRLLALAPPS